MHLLDTCVLSESVKAKPNPHVAAWLDAREPHEVYLSAISLGEIVKGIDALRDPIRQNRLRLWLEHTLRPALGAHVLPVDGPVAERWGAMCGASQRQGVVLPVVDALIAATAKVHGLVVVTRNVADFERCGVDVFNPWLAPEVG